MHRDEAVALLTRYRKLFQVAYIFGSVARGEDDEYSDLDVIIVRDTELPFPDRGRDFIDMIWESGGAELLIYTPDEFSRQVAKDGFVAQVLQEAIRIEGEQERGRAVVEPSSE